MKRILNRFLLTRARAALVLCTIFACVIYPSALAQQCVPPSTPAACLQVNSGLAYSEYLAQKQSCQSDPNSLWKEALCLCQQNYACGMTEEEFLSESDQCAARGFILRNCVCQPGGGPRCYPDPNCTGGFDEDCNCLEPPPPPSPIIIDIAGEGFHLTSAAAGVLFDINADGKLEQVSWSNSAFRSAFLVLDRNGNGRIDSGAELFGNFTPQPPSTEKNGFLALAEYEKPVNGGNGDGIIDSHDLVFASLRLWVDLNHNGISEPEELFTLPSVGVYSISLDYREARRRDEFGNIFRYRAKINAGTETERFAYDVLLLRAPGSVTTMAGRKVGVQVTTMAGRKVGVQDETLDFRRILDLADWKLALQ